MSSPHTSSNKKKRGRPRKYDDLDGISGKEYRSEKDKRIRRERKERERQLFKMMKEMHDKDGAKVVEGLGRVVSYFESTDGNRKDLLQGCWAREDLRPTDNRDDLEIIETRCPTPISAKVPRNGEKESREDISDGEIIEDRSPTSIRRDLSAKVPQKKEMAQIPRKNKPSSPVPKFCQPKDTSLDTLGKAIKIRYQKSNKSKEPQLPRLQDMNEYLEQMDRKELEGVRELSFRVRDHSLEEHQKYGPHATSIHAFSRDLAADAGNKIHSCPVSELDKKKVCSHIHKLVNMSFPPGEARRTAKFAAGQILEHEDFTQRRSEKSNYTVDNIQLQRQLRTKGKELASCKDELQTKEEQLKSQKKINVIMESKLASCQDELQTKDEELASCEDELQTKGKELASCKDELQTKEEQLKSQKKINSIMESKLASCKDQLSNAQRLILSNVKNTNLDGATRNLFSDLLLEMMNGA